MEIECVCRYLLNNHKISLTSNNKWLNDCIRWFKTNPNLSATYGSLQEYVTVQWLLSDLKDVRNSCLPDVTDIEATVFSGNYAVQINWMRDIGESCYSQYRSIKHKDASVNDEVTAEETKKQSWEPNPKRVLMMEITDGVKTMKAMEYGSIPKLGVGFLPGMKVLLKGPIECRRKILFLKNSNIDIFGGELEELYELNRTENVLSRCLNLPDLRPNPAPVQYGTSAVSERSISSNGPIGNSQTYSFLPSGSDRSIQSKASVQNRLQSNTPVLTDKTLSENNLSNPTNSIIEYSKINGNEEMDILEDDDFLNQLPDEMLDNDYADSCENGSIKLSPVLYRVSDVSDNFHSPQPGPSTHFQAPPRTSSQRSLKISKTKRFPSLDVFSSEGKSDSSASKTAKIQSTLTNFVSPKTSVISPTSTEVVHNFSKYFSPVNSPLPLSPIVVSDSSGPSPGNSSNSPVVPFIPTSSSTCVKYTKEISRKEIEGHTRSCNDSQSSIESSSTNNVETRNRSDYKRDDTSSLDDEHIIEIKDIKTQKCKVINVSKLKVKDQKWTCEVNVNINGQTKRAHLSNKVAVEIFGIEAAKMESLKKEILTNPMTKQDMNRILQAGNAKIKSLDCLMTLEYSANDSVPVIISIFNNS